MNGCLPPHPWAESAPPPDPGPVFASCRVAVVLSGQVSFDPDEGCARTIEGVVVADPPVSFARYTDHIGQRLGSLEGVFHLDQGDGSTVSIPVRNVAYVHTFEPHPSEAVTSEAPA